METMTFIFPVAKEVVIEAWEEEGELMEGTVVVELPTKEVPREIRRQWACRKIYLLGYSVQENDLKYSRPFILGEGVEAPVDKGPGVDQDLVAELAIALREVERLKQERIERVVEGWFGETQPDRFDTPAVRTPWVRLPDGYEASSQKEAVEIEHRRRCAVRRQWIEDQARQAREDAKRADEVIEAREASMKRSEEAWMQWASKHGTDDLRAAIEQDYPYENQIEREVSWLLPSAPDHAEWFDGDYFLGGDRPVPNARARQLCADLEEAAEELRPKLPPCVLAVSRIQRVEIDDATIESASDEWSKRTGVEVSITAPHLEDPITGLYLVKE